ncbi:hypothetical protein PMIN06_004545 [Paraphaeosphaeria minitans]
MALHLAVFFFPFLSDQRHVPIHQGKNIQKPKKGEQEKNSDLFCPFAHQSFGHMSDLSSVQVAIPGTYVRANSPYVRKHARFTALGKMVIPKGAEQRDDSMLYRRKW